MTDQTTSAVEDARQDAEYMTACDECRSPIRQSEIVWVPVPRQFDPRGYMPMCAKCAEEFE